MKEIKDNAFVVIDNQVAMTEEAVADLLNIDVEKLRAVSDHIGITNSEKGIYEQDGKYLYTSQEIIFKIRNTNDKKSADLSTGGIILAFQKAEDRLLPEDFVKEKRKKEKKENLKFWAVIFVILFGIYLIGGSDKDTSTPVQTKTTTSAPAPKRESPSLGFTPAEFAQRFNQQSQALASQFGFQVPAPDILDSGTFGYNFNGYEMWGIIDKDSGKVIEIRITGIPLNPEQSARLLMLYAVTMSVTNPELQAEQRGEVLKQLGFTGAQGTDLTQLNSRIKVGNFSYTAKFDKNSGFIFVITSRY